MRTRWLMCVLMGAIAWGQAAPENAAPKGATPAPGAQEPGETRSMPAKPAAPKEVSMETVILTIKGVCPATASGAKTAAARTAAGKTASAKKPECETKITRAQFEKIANGLSPNVTPQLKRQLEQALPKFMAMSEIARKQGLENTEHYKETIKIARMQILTQELQREAQDKADNVPQSEIVDYYKKNPEAYQQFSLDRLFIPRYKSVQAEAKDEDDKDKDKDAKLTDEQQKAKDAEAKEKQEKSEQELNKLADDLRERAAKGEDFVTLQKEAFAASGTKVENPTVNLPKVRRTGLPPAHAAVFDLKVGEVSQVISDNGGHYIYKVVSMEELPLDQVQTEIHNKLKGERLKAAMDKYNSSYSVEPNEAYFGPPAGPGPVPPRRPGMPGMMGGRPMQPGAPQGAPPNAPPPSAAPQGAPPSSAPPAQAPTAPPSKQN